VAPDVRDPTVYCAGEVVDEHRTVTDVALFVSRDRGRTWTKATGSGLTVQPAGAAGEVLLDLFVSPEHAVDHTVFLDLAPGGLYESTDYGTTFLIVDPLLGTRPVRPFVTGVSAAATGSVGRRTTLVAAATSNVDGANASVLIDPVTHSRTPIKGTPGRDIAYAVSPNYLEDHRAFAVGASGAGTGALTVYGCNLAFDCSTPLKQFPAYSRFGRIWISGSLVAISIDDGAGHFAVWRSTDGGAHWSVWRPVQSILAAYKLGAPYYDLVFPTARTVYLRTSFDGYREPPGEQLFVSRDNGNTFTRIAWGKEPPGPAGTMPLLPLPMTNGDQNLRAGIVAVGPDGRIFEIGRRRDRTGFTSTFACTVDNGRHWAYRCAK
jgi:hypothetical protein